MERGLMEDEPRRRIPVQEFTESDLEADRSSYFRRYN